MNFLAHAYLSFEKPEILVGNMISDFVKGRARFSFNGKIQSGIELHRRIDGFTDAHPATKKAKEIFRPVYRLYSGAIMDVLYDHFLANDLQIFSNGIALKRFTENTYASLEEQTHHLPANFLVVFTYMKSQDWLFHYREKEGIRNSLSGLVRRAAYISDSRPAYNLFNEHFVHLEDCYKEFFPDVKRFAKEQLEALL